MGSTIGSLKFSIVENSFKARFAKIIFSEHGLKFLTIETFSESGAKTLELWWWSSG